MAAVKSEAYKRGRRAGAANYPEDSNPYPHAIGEHGQWRTGWTDGYTDIGWSKKPKKAPVAKTA